MVSFFSTLIWPVSYRLLLYSKSFDHSENLNFCTKRESKTLTFNELVKEKQIFLKRRKIISVIVREKRN